MRKKVIAVILIALLIVELVVGAFLLFDIQVLSFPKTTISVDIVEITPNEVFLRHTIEIHNTNAFDVIVKDFEIEATTDTGETVATIIENGGVIPSNGNKTFSADDSLAFHGAVPDLLTSTVTGTIGFKLFGIIEKTLPLDITVLTTFKDVIEQIVLPTAHIGVEFGDISSTDIELLATIDVSNPNTAFEMSLSDASMSIETDTGDVVGEFQIDDVLIPADGSVTTHGQGYVLLEALDAKKLLVTITANAGVNIAGLSKTLPFNSEMEITLPPIQDYLTKDAPLELAIGIDFKLAKGGLLGDVTLELDNPTKLPLYARDIVVEYYAVRGDEKTFLGNSIIGDGEISAQNLTIFKGEILLPLTSIFKPLSGSLLPDSLFARLNVNLSIASLNQSLWVALGSYTDLHILKTLK